MGRKLERMRNFFSSFLFHPRFDDSMMLLRWDESVILIVRMILCYFGFAILTSLLFLPVLRLLNLLPEPSLRLSEIPLSFKLIAFVPIIEEIIFRLPLRFSKQNLFLSLAALQFLLFYHTYSLIVLILISGMIIVVPYLKLIPDSFYSRLELIWKKQFSFLFYGLALSFGLLHLTNFEGLRFGHYLFSPFIVSNQIFMGLILGYVRVTLKNGFVYSVLLHFLINLPLIMVSHL